MLGLLTTLFPYPHRGYPYHYAKITNIIWNFRSTPGALNIRVSDTVAILVLKLEYLYVVVMSYSYGKKNQKLCYVPTPMAPLLAPRSQKFKSRTHPPTSDAKGKLAFFLLMT